MYLSRVALAPRVRERRKDRNDNAAPFPRETPLHTPRIPYPSAISQRKWSVYGAQRARPVATDGKLDASETRSNRPIRSRWQSTATASKRMVRRGSTVRVRQRACRVTRLSRLRIAGARRGGRPGG